MWFDEEQSKHDIIEVGKMLYNKGLNVSTDGNISIRISENEILITASGYSKAKLTPDLITKVDLEGNIIYGKMPARDLRMHLATYKTRSDAKAIVHSHAPITTGFAITETDLSQITLPEILFTLGRVGITEYATPTTAEVPKTIIKKLNENKEYGALILANHGALTFGANIMEAYYKLETLEMFLTATLVSKILGNIRTLPNEEVEKIMHLKNGGTEYNYGTQVSGMSQNEMNKTEMKSLISEIVEDVIRKMNQ